MMGRGKNTVKTYGRHRQRVVSSDTCNLWSSGDKRHVFSTSSSMDSSLDLTNNSASDVVFEPRSTRAKAGRNVQNGRKTRDKENLGKTCTKRMMLRSHYGSDGQESCSSTGSDSLFKPRRQRRPLRDKNYKESPVNSNRPCTYGKRKHAKVTTYKEKTSQSSDANSYNFSEFDDYSLVVSGSPVKESAKNSGGAKHGIFSPHLLRSDKELAVETSTPCSKRTRSCQPLTEAMKGGDISYIECVEDSPIPSCPQSEHSSSHSSNVSDDLDKLCISSIAHSPFVDVTEKDASTKSNRRASNNCDKRDSPIDKCLEQLEKLRENFRSVHLTKPRNTSMNQLDSLFSNVNSTSDSDISHYLTPDCGKDSNTEDDDEHSNDTKDSNSEYEDSDLSDICEVDEEDDDDDDDDDEEDAGDVSLNDRHPRSSEETLYMLTEQSNSRASSEGEQSLYCTAESGNESVHMENSILSNESSLHNKSVFDMITPKKKNAVDPVSPRSKVLQVCHQTSPVTFQDCIPNSMMQKCKKVGEGVYGEVFTTKNHRHPVALKVIPIEGDFLVNDEKQKSFAEILPEIVISKELSLLRENEECYTENFCEVRSVSCVRGRYPDKLLEQWDEFHETKESENDRPDVFGDSQLFIVFEFADGGKDLESYKFNNIQEARSVFCQVAFSLAVAEQGLNFEHRDLHWGNILVKNTNRKYHMYQLLGKTYEIQSHRVDVNIIDFTLSRLEKDGCTVYIDLATDDSLFEGTGDYQFDIYRNMKEENGNNWEPFLPRTNVMWLHYVADKLIRSKQYQRNNKTDQAVLRQFKTFVKSMLEFHSACELIVCSEFLNS